MGFIFGTMLDVNMLVTSAFPFGTLPAQIAAQFLGCVVLGIGISFEVRCGSITMPGEGFPAAISKLTGKPFSKIKILVDVLLVTIAVILGYIYFGCWQWNVVGGGTLFAMVFVGLVVKFMDGYMGWFNRVLCYRPGFRRYIYGLAKHINKQNSSYKWIIRHSCLR